MSVVGTALNKVTLKIGAVAVKAFPDVCGILRSSNSSKGTDGGYISGDTDLTYSNVPCSYKPKLTGYKEIEGGRERSTVEYIVTIPRATSAGAIINFVIDTDLITVSPRGLEGSIPFKPIAVMNKTGVVLKILCEKLS